MLKEYNKQFNENNLSVKNLKGEIEQIYNRHSFNIVEKINDTNEFIIFDGVNKYIVRLLIV